MKDLIIKTVDIMVIAFVIIVTLASLIAGISMQGFFTGLLTGGLAFLFSSMIAGTWILLTRINDGIKSINAELKLQNKKEV